MKKTFSYLAIGFSTAFFAAQAQETAQDPTSATQSQQQAADMQGKKEISESQLPEVVQQSLQNSDYGDLSIVTVYELADTAATSSQETRKKAPGTAAYREALQETGDDSQQDKSKQQKAEGEHKQAMHQQDRQQAPAETNDTDSKGMEYSSESGYSPDTAAHKTYEKTSASTAQSSEQQQDTHASEQNSSAEGEQSQTSAQSSQPDVLNEGDEQRQGDQLELHETEQAQSVSPEADTGKMYEVQVQDKDEDTLIILVFTEDGTLQQATEGGM